MTHLQFHYQILSQEKFGGAPCVIYFVTGVFWKLLLTGSLKFGTSPTITCAKLEALL